MKAMAIIMLLCLTGPSLPQKVKEHNARIDAQIKLIDQQIDSLKQKRDSLANEKLYYFRDLSPHEQLRRMQN